MKKRTFLSVLLCAVFFAAGAGMAAAQDNLAVLPFTGGRGGEGETLARILSEDWADAVRNQSGAAASRTAASQDSGAKKKSGGGAAFGYGALNLVLGLGSFLQKDVAGGVITLVSYGAAAGLLGWEFTLSYSDDLAGIPGTVGLGVAGAAVVFGFIRPFMYQKNHALAGVMDGIQMGVAPVEGGGAAVRLSYTMRF